MVFNTIVPICPGKPFAFSLLRAFYLLSFEFFCFLFFCFLFSCFFPCGVFFFYDDDGDVDTRTLFFDDLLMKEILAGRSDDFFGTTNFLTIFSSRTFQGEEPLDTGGGRVFLLPRCLFWSSGHTPAPGAPR